MSEHTPGPWIADAHFAQREGGRTYIPVLRPGNDPVPLAVVYRDVDGYGKGVGEANARLIAAAPDLLAVLQSISKAFWSDGETESERIADLKAMARIAIAKATGESAAHAEGSADS